MTLHATLCGGTAAGHTNSLKRIRRTHHNCREAYFNKPACGKGANPQPTPEFGEILFEVTHVNHAWGYSLSGIFIDADGMVCSYRWGNASQPWEPADPGRLTQADMDRKCAINRDTLGYIAPATLTAMRDLIPAAGAGTMTDPLHQRADYGQKSWLAFTCDSEIGDYRRVVIAVAGDYAVKNLSVETSTLSAWLRIVAGDSGNVVCGYPE